MSITPRVSCFEHEHVRDFSDAQLAALQRIAKVLPPGAIEWFGSREVKFQQFCGLIPLGDTTLEVLPKIDGDQTHGVDGNDEKVRSRTALISMLNFVGDFRITEVQRANAASQNTLLDFFIRLFADEVATIAHRGLPRRYEVIEDIPAALRGRLDLPRLLRQSPAQQHRIPCRYDELTINTLICRILKAAAERAWRVARYSETRRRVGQVLFLLDEITDTRGITAADVARVQPDRTTQRFERVLKLAKWLLEECAPDTQVGKTPSWGLLFDMNLLFERCVQRHLQLQLPGYVVSFQKPQLNLFNEPQKVTLKPDILIKKMGGGQEVVAIVDAKWKMIERDNISPADVYQMTAYRTAYGCNQLALVYPQPHGKDSDWCTRWERTGEDAFSLDICRLAVPAGEKCEFSGEKKWGWLNELDELALRVAA